MSDIRSLKPHTVNIMALTATASDETVREIIQDIGVLNPITVQVSPDKQNLLFGIQAVEGLEEVFLPIINQLRTKKMKFGCTISFANASLIAEVCMTCLAGAC